jgi:hypothetical protein
MHFSLAWILFYFHSFAVFSSRLHTSAVFIGLYLQVFEFSSTNNLLLYKSKGKYDRKSYLKPRVLISDESSLCKQFH